MPQAVQAMSGMTFGCDPELFIKNQETGEFVSPDNIIPGTKEEPYKVPGGAVQQDGMAAEFNIDPVDNFTDFNKNIVKVMRSLGQFLPKNHILVGTPTAQFSKKVWEATSEKSKELGCSPDANAWTGDFNPPPEPTGKLERVRTGSGHLHFGWTDDANMSDPDHVKNCRDLIKQLDWFLGPWSIDYDPDTLRRSLYGKAGACRFKPYGVEYRVLSNFWVGTLDMRKSVWNRMNAAIWAMKDHFMPEVAVIGKPNSPGFYDFNVALVTEINTSQMNPTLRANFSFPTRNMSSDFDSLPTEAYKAY